MAVWPDGCRVAPAAWTAVVAATLASQTVASRGGLGSYGRAPAAASGAPGLEKGVQPGYWDCMLGCDGAAAEDAAAVGRCGSWAAPAALSAGVAMLNCSGL